MPKNPIRRAGGGVGLMVILIIGALIGTVFGEVIGLLSPGGILEKVFSKGINPGLVPPATIDLKVISLTFGFSLKLNLASILGVVFALYIYRKI